MKPAAPSLLVLLLAACPARTPDGEPTPPRSVMPTPPPSVTAAPAPARLKGGWTVVVTSESPDIPPEMFDTPEERAKVFFNHAASVEGDRVVVEHKTLGKRFDDEGSALDAVMATTDWGAVTASVAADRPSEGGTVFRFVISRGEERFDIATSRVEEHPELTKILDAVKAISGVP